MHENPFLGSCWKSFCAFRDVRDPAQATTPNKPIIPWEASRPAGRADFSGPANEDGPNRFRRAPATPLHGTLLPLICQGEVEARRNTSNSGLSRASKG
ncbi:hypothetical protein [Azospirillum largimobile]